MFCKNCHKFNMTSDCIYCGFHNDGKPVEKKVQPKEVNNEGVESPVVEHLPESTIVDLNSKAKQLKILNIVAVSLFGLAILLQLISFFRFRFLLMGYGAISFLMPLCYSVAVVPCILYLASSKYREKYAEKKHMTITIICLVIAVSLIFSALMSSVNIRRFMRF